MDPTVLLSTLEVMCWLMIMHIVDSGRREQESKSLLLPYQTDQQWLNPLVLTGALSLMVLL